MLYASANLQSSIPNPKFKKALPGTPLPVNAPQFYPAFVASYAGYEEYVGQNLSKDLNHSAL